MLTKIFSFIILSASFFLLSCGDDTVNQETSAGTVLYKMDSIAVWLNPGTGFGLRSEIFQQTISASRVKVEYTVQTNVDSIHSEAWVKDSSNGSVPHVVEQYYYWNVDSLVSYTMDIPAQPIHLRLEVRMNSYGSIIPHYIRLKNIKVTKQ